ncbi:MAG: hypothetical protein VKP62_15835 [Candidatus Sericytochromatia bacterium]|nr:hypothetical protein [Candidatus Sericytochromatia bacterium]
MPDDDLHEVPLSVAETFTLVAAGTFGGLLGSLVYSVLLYVLDGLWCWPWQVLSRTFWEAGASIVVAQCCPFLAPVVGIVFLVRASGFFGCILIGAALGLQLVGQFARRRS